MVHGLWFHCHQEFPVKKEAGAKKEEIVPTGAETETEQAGDNQTEVAPLAPAAAAAETTGAAAAAETPATAAAAAEAETPAAAPAAAMGIGGSGKPAEPAANVQKKDEKRTC